MHAAQISQCVTKTYQHLLNTPQGLTTLATHEINRLSSCSYQQRFTILSCRNNMSHITIQNFHYSVIQAPIIIAIIIKQENNEWRIVKD